MADAPDIGPIIQRERKARHLTLERLAQLSGVSRSMLSQIERGESNPTFAVLWGLTQALKIDLADLISGGVAHGQANSVDVVTVAHTPEIKSPEGHWRLRILSPPALAGRVEWYEVEIAPRGKLASAPHAAGDLRAPDGADGRAAGRDGAGAAVAECRRDGPLSGRRRAPDRQPGRRRRTGADGGGLRGLKLHQAGDELDRLVGRAASVDLEEGQVEPVDFPPQPLGEHVVALEQVAQRLAADRWCGWGSPTACRAPRRQRRGSRRSAAARGRGGGAPGAARPGAAAGGGLRPAPGSTGDRRAGRGGGGRRPRR